MKIQYVKNGVKYITQFVPKKYAMLGLHHQQNFINILWNHFTDNKSIDQSCDNHITSETTQIDIGQSIIKIDKIY